MATGIIQLNDGAVHLNVDGGISVCSPGYAVVVGDHVHIGDEGFRRSRLHPLSSYNEFWHALSEQALRKPTRHYRHHADLAFAHLQRLYEQGGRPDELLFAVPGDMSREQLSLLLGLTGASRFRAGGLVDIGVAAAAAVAGPGRFAYLDLHLHRAVITVLNVGERVEREVVISVPESGLQKIHDACANAVIHAFIRDQRFDPQAEAVTEQALYDHLRVWLAALRTNDTVTLELEYRGLEYRTQLNRAMIAETLARYLAPIRSAIPPAATLLVNEGSSHLPGITDYFGTAHMVTAAEIADTCLRHLRHIRSTGEAMGFVTRLPAASTPRCHVQTPDRHVATANAHGSLPTHILSGSLALEIGVRPIYLHRSGAITARAGLDAAAKVRAVHGISTVQTVDGGAIWVNERPAGDATPLATGDQVRVSGCSAVFLCISAGAPDAA